MSQAPNFFSEPSPALLPQARQRALTRGKKIPPALAETEGIAGAKIASLNTREYPRPRLVDPKSLTNWLGFKGEKGGKEGNQVAQFSWGIEFLVKSNGWGDGEIAKRSTKGQR